MQQQRAWLINGCSFSIQDFLWSIRQTCLTRISTNFENRLGASYSSLADAPQVHSDILHLEYRLQISILYHLLHCFLQS